MVTTSALRGIFDTKPAKLQELLGHARIATVEFYTRVVASKLRSVYDRTHPHA